MTGRPLGQSGQVQRLPGNRRREEKVLRTRTWGGWPPGLWAGTLDTKSFCPASAAISPFQPQGAGEE